MNQLTRQSENRPRKRGQSPFAPKTAQKGTVPDGSRVIGAGDAEKPPADVAPRETLRLADFRPTASPRRLTWRDAAIWGWIILAVSLSVKTIIEPRIHSVYPGAADAARHWWQGTSLYVEQEYFYSPTFAVGMTPFAIWPDWFGGVLWGLANIGLLLYSLRVFYRDVLARFAWPPDAEWQFLLFVLVGSVRSFWSLQSNAMISALVLLGAAAVVRGRWWRAAIWLAAPVYIKVWPLIAAGLFAVQWPKRLTARLAIVIGVLGLIPFFAQAPTVVARQYGDWYQSLSERQVHGSRYGGYRDAWTIWEQIRSPVDRQQYLVLQMGLGLAVLSWCLWQRRRGLPAAQLVMQTIAAWCVWQLFCGPGTERLTYNLIAPAMAWGILASYHERRGRAWITAAAVTTYLFSFGGTERMLTAWWPGATMLEPIGVLLFGGWLVWHAAWDRSMEAAVTLPLLLVEPDESELVRRAA